MEKITLIIADDHHVVREGTIKMLEQDSTFEILAEASNGSEAVSLTLLKQPDILLLDVSMPDLNGMEVIRKLKKANLNQKIVMFSAHADLQYVNAAMKEGVDGYLTKNTGSADLCSFLKRAAQGERVYSNDVSSRLVNEMWSAKQTKSNLTAREYEIMTLVAKGYSNQDVANDLCIAVRTVETHVANILKKLKLTNRTQISRYAYEKGII